MGLSAHRVLLCLNGESFDTYNVLGGETHKLNYINNPLPRHQAVYS